MAEKYTCPECGRDDVSLTANGRLRSHAANGKRASETNPHCPGGSGWPKHEHAYNTPGTGGAFESPAPLCDVCGEPDPRPSEKDVRNAESVCASADAPEEVFSEAEHILWAAAEHGIRPDAPAHGGPNPHRPPLPGGVHDTPEAPMGGPSETPADADPATATADPATVTADSFLGGDAPEEDRSPKYFESRYDGDCDTCGRHFDAGDEIRSDGQGGWEGKDCCGDELDEAAEQRPRSTAPQLPVKGGRYRGPDPETGKAASFMRTTNFAEAIADKIMLNEWQLRMCVLGLVKRPDLLARAQSMVQAHGGIPLYELAKLQRQVLNGISLDARLAAGSKERARKGTILHKHTQELDMGRKTLNDVPQEFRRDAQAYLKVMEEQGFACIPDLIERSTALPSYQVAGTFDRILRVTQDQEMVTLDEGRAVQLHAGEFVIGDVKSGADLSYAWLEILIQLSVYAHGVEEAGVAVPEPSPNGPPTWRWAALSEFGVERIRTDVGIVMHVPYGEGRAQLKYADLVTGWRGAKICKTALDYRKIADGHEVAVKDYVTIPQESTFTAAGSHTAGHAKWVTAGTKRAEAAAVVKAAPTGKPAGKRRTWEDVGAAVKTPDEANTVWRKMKDSGQPDDRIKRVVTIMKAALAAA